MTRTPAPPELRIDGLPPGLPETDAAVLRSRLSLAVGEVVRKHGPAAGRLSITLGGGAEAGPPAAPPAAARPRFASAPPDPVGDRLVLPADVLAAVRRHVRRFEHRGRLYDGRGLRGIDPHPRALLHLSGPPGCGKTLLAHAIAAWVGRPLLAASYPEVVSKYPGEGPANVDALFAAAARDGAVLFVDEADGLLSARVAGAQQGADLERNAVVNQFLVAAERFEGVLVTATNSDGCDPALLSRVAHVRVPPPDAAGRRALWAAHIRPAMRPAADVCPDALAAVDGLTGRDIRNAVIDAVTAAELDDDGAPLTLRHLLDAAGRILAARAPVGGVDAAKARAALLAAGEKSAPLPPATA